MRKYSLILGLLITGMPFAKEINPVEPIFSQEQVIQYVLDIESALAQAQAQLGIIPQWAASEISKTATIKNVSVAEWQKENDIVNARLVAVLNIWTKKMDPKAAEYVHFGATTVDVYDTLMVLQLRKAIPLVIKELKAIEITMIAMAKKYKNTPMAGRTLGQQALPISFGKKVSTWIAENRRNIERLKSVLQHLDNMAILKGAVGSYNGLGPKGIELEQLFSRKMGMKEAIPADWHASRDLFAEYAFDLALISKEWQRIGNEIFLLEMVEIGEINETESARTVGSSTMPQKVNPKHVTDMQYEGNYIPALSQVLLDGVVNFFERQNTDQLNQLTGQITIESWKNIHNASNVLRDLTVHTDRMRANLDLTKGLILSQRVTFFLAKTMGKTTANQLMHEIVKQAIQDNISLKEALMKNPKTVKLISTKDMEELLDPTTYLGLDGQQVDRVIAETLKLQETDPKE